MYPNQSQPPAMYTARHYNYNPSPNNNYSSYPQTRSGDFAPPPYPYYTSYPPPTSVSYVNDRSNYGQSSGQSSSYVPPSPTRYQTNNNYPRSSSLGPSNNRQPGNGQIEKSNYMSNDSPFYDPARSQEPINSSRTVNSITSHPKSGGTTNKTLNLSDENPFHSIYGGYHYPSQIDPSKRITTQNTNNRPGENKTLNLSEENPFFSIYGGYHYPSQIDPSKRITEMPKQSGPLQQTNNLSDENPFSRYQPPPPPPMNNHYQPPANNHYQPPPMNHYQPPPMNHYQPPPQPRYQSNQHEDDYPAPLSYRPMAVQRPVENYYEPPTNPTPKPSGPLDKTSLNMSPENPFAETYGQRYYPSAEEARAQKTPKQPAKSSAPLDKTSLNMSPENPFAETYGHYHYPSNEEIKAQKRSNLRAAAAPQENNNNGAGQNKMSEYPESEKQEPISGKGNSKFMRFDVNF